MEESIWGRNGSASIQKQIYKIDETIRMWNMFHVKQLLNNQVLDILL
jgi:hypothetical protein